jgi:hypothetical protein
MGSEVLAVITARIPPMNSASRRRHIIIALALLGVMARALIPVGFMPVMNQAGGISLALCSSYGGAKLFQATARDSTQKQADSHDDQCPFEHATGMSAIPTSPSVALSSVESPLPSSIFAGLANSNRPRNRYSARAPPVLS